MHAHERTSRQRARARQNICARVYDSYVRVHARIFTKKNLVVKSYLVNLSFKFGKDLSFRWGDIPLFVTVYYLQNKTLGFFHHELWPKVKKIFRLFGTPLGLFLIQISTNNLNFDRRKKNHAFSINIKVRRKLWLTMKKWHNFLSICILMKFDHMYIYKNWLL